MLSISRSRGLLVATLAILASVSFSALAETPIKKSNSGICHDTTSAWYGKTNNFTPFESMKLCVAFGGRTPKGYKGGDNTTSKRNTSGNSNKNYVSKGYTGSNIKYNRKTWPHWSDTDRDCQDTRAEVLINQSKTPVMFSGSKFKKCYVTTGIWYDPYSNKTYYNDDDLDVDHIVPLAYAHSRGGSKWNKLQKQRFANDYENLLAVQNSLNRQKSAKGPSEWMPPHQAYRCEYLKSFDTIVSKYDLVYWKSEKRTIDKMKKACDF